ncbi:MULTISPECIES: hypothetical protein [unclassified Streptomyces]|uniref:hypothetical protein n=1 Tax=unclassified Streptomyces TaxID=2593676 RepID=UPI0006AE4A94|nr:MULTISPECIES: hypothetical protein [unclassified Streptomyces]KOX36272.1 hypothetical protein ADL08_32885 [Streptomyces sp. NRRL F-6492]KOX36531.1 hypothetical protein ADL06_04510 [Streptomyces sp. NRRL F-6491]
MRAARTLAVTATAIAAVGLAAPLAAATNSPGNVLHGGSNGSNDGQNGGQGGGNGNNNGGQGGNGNNGGQGGGNGNNNGGQGGNGNNGGQGGGNGNNGPSNVTVNPFDVHPGSTLTITARGCNRGGTVTSNAFPETTLSGNNNGVSTAVARVYNHATPGNYNLAVRCNGNSSVVTQSFRVLPGRGAQGGLGGSLAPSSTEMALGGSLVAAAALGGGLFVARRRRVTGAGI